MTPTKVKDNKCRKKSFDLYNKKINAELMCY